ncbi:hypothetical protein Y09_2658 [Brachybacterium sp. SW0106-09]|nr:hypothetical protein Y09_2658 [Brachybacterium sp. SW0106-09]
MDCRPDTRARRPTGGPFPGRPLPLPSASWQDGSHGGVRTGWSRAELTKG